MTSTTETIRPEDRLREHYDLLSPELQRAADWVISHPAEVGLWSMRRQASALSVSPATMLRLARAIGYTSYNSFRQPFQRALVEPLGDSVRRVQQAHRHAGSTQRDQIANLQQQAIAKATHLNTPDAIDAAAYAVLQAGQVGFLGSRICHCLAMHLHYAYHLLKNNGSLIDGAGGMLSEQVHAMQPDDAIIVIALRPYSRSTIEAAVMAHQQGTRLIALTDDQQSPLNALATHALLFGSTASESTLAPSSQATFFHTIIGATALIEQLLSRIAALGGMEVERRASEIDKRLQQAKAYWEIDTNVPSFTDFFRTLS